MVWLFATVVFLTVVWLLVISETFRKVAVWGVIALAAVGGWLYFNGQRKERLALTSMAYDMDARYLVYRLAVCSIEDVGLGNLYGVAVTLALAGSLPNRRIGGERKTSVWLAAQLAGGLKDRSACNMVLAVDFDRSLHPVTQEWGRLSDDDLAQKAADLSRPVQERMAAAWSLAGTKRFPNTNAPEWNDRPRWSLMSLMARSGMPLILYYIADRAAVRGGGCMFVSILPIWQVLQAEIETLSVVEDDLPDDPGIGPFLACAYDMHTREGQAAIRRLMHEPEVASALSAIPNPGDRLAALFEAVFFVEGGLLDCRSSTPSLARLQQDAQDAVLAYFGLATRVAQDQLLRAVHVAREALQRYRPS